MNEMKTNTKEPYETPEVLDIKPVSVCMGAYGDTGDVSMEE